VTKLIYNFSPVFQGVKTVSFTIAWIGDRHFYLRLSNLTFIYDDKSVDM